MTAPKAAAPAVVEKAAAKIDAGEPLNDREAKALEAQDAIDQERGYRRIEWKPNVYLWQHIATGHTTPGGEAGELEMRRVHNDYQMSRIGG